MKDMPMCMLGRVVEHNSPARLTDKKIGMVMREYKAGKLKSSSGQKVKKRDQAVAIAMSESGMSKKAHKKGGHY